MFFISRLEGKFQKGSDLNSFQHAAPNSDPKIAKMFTPGVLGYAHGRSHVLWKSPGPTLLGFTGISG